MDEGFEEKFDNLDDLLLFATSSVGIFITLFSVFLGTVIEAINILFMFPFLLLAWFLPLYIGYWRGVIHSEYVDIKLAALMERMRGWCYFLVGTVGYGIYATILPIWILFGVEISTSYGIFMGGTLATMILFLKRRIKEFIRTWIDEGYMERVDEILFKTIASGSILMFVSIITVASITMSDLLIARAERIMGITKEFSKYFTLYGSVAVLNTILLFLAWKIEERTRLRVLTISEI